MRFLLFACCLYFSFSLRSQAVFVSNCAPYPNYTITINAIPQSLVIKNPAGWGCNVDIVFAYTVTVTGYIPNGWCGGGTGGSLNNAKISIGCSNDNFEVDIPRTAGSGTVMSGNNQGVHEIPYCTGLNVNNYCAGRKMNTTISGPGLSSSTKPINGSALPIELFAFTAEKIDNNIVLYWATASEKNNDFFTIEKSADAINWEAIGEVKGAGNSTSKKYYSFTDEKAYQGLNYYRLKQTDYNGDFDYSYIVDVNALQPKTEGFVLYPNPANDLVSLHGIKYPAQIVVSNQLGETVKAVVKLNETSATINTDHLMPGIYYVTVVSESESITKKLVIQK